MKKYIYLLATIYSFFTLTSCGTTSDDPSKITYFVKLELLGEETMHVPLGSTFTDPGVTAFEGETNVTSSVVKKGTVNANKVGYYPITYSAKNVDGFSKSIERTVFVYDPKMTTDLAGIYTVAAGTYRLNLTNGAKTPYSGFKVIISPYLPGIFYVSDFFGGYYDQRVNYGPDYAMTGYFALYEDNTLELLYSSVRGWGDSLDDLDETEYDPETGSLSWAATYVSSFTFYVTLTNNNDNKILN